MAKIYVASSWRNQYYPEVVTRLREAGHEVYDFRNPPHGGNGFRWTDIDENAPNWTFDQYAEGLHHPKAQRQFTADIDALQWANVCVLVLPCGRSAHTEAGWMAGAGKPVVAYIPEMQEPELMYKLFDNVVDSIDELNNSITTLINRAATTIKPIDLGLSVLWADRNLGAISSIDYGEYYGWTTNGGRYILTGFDGKKARKFDGWRLPTWEEYLELIKNCQWSGKWEKNNYGWIALGPSGDSVFFPFGGHLNRSFDRTEPVVNSYGLFLSSTIRFGNCTFLRLERNSPEMEPRGDITGFLSVRLVKDK